VRARLSIRQDAITINEPLALNCAALGAPLAAIAANAASPSTLDGLGVALYRRQPRSDLSPDLSSLAANLGPISPISLYGAVDPKVPG
jgi:hypothetical protein